MSRIPIDDENADADTDADAAEEAGEQGDSNELLKLQAERDDLYQRLARATADFQNTRKRLESEFDQRMQYANSNLIKSLLPVIDNFERALAIDPKKTDPATILKGMQIVHDQWMKVLKDQRVEEIAPEPGTPFDPSKHEALMQTQDVTDSPTVMQLLQKGYGLHGRTLRPAQVAVSRTS
jgi:molecular chaperone GrpE